MPLATLTNVFQLQTHMTNNDDTRQLWYHKEINIHTQKLSIHILLNDNVMKWICKLLIDAMWENEDLLDIRKKVRCALYASSHCNLTIVRRAQYTRNALKEKDLLSMIQLIHSLLQYKRNAFDRRRYQAMLSLCKRWKKACVLVCFYKQAVSLDVKVGAMFE